MLRGGGSYSNLISLRVHYSTPVGYILRGGAFYRSVQPPYIFPLALCLHFFFVPLLPSPVNHHSDQAYQSVCGVFSPLPIPPPIAHWCHNPSSSVAAYRHDVMIEKHGHRETDLSVVVQKLGLCVVGNVESVAAKEDVVGKVAGAQETSHYVVYVFTILTISTG